MICKFCYSANTRVLETRVYKEASVTLRRCVCLDCSTPDNPSRFTTIEEWGRVRMENGKVVEVIYENESDECEQTG